MEDVAVLPQRLLVEVVVGHLIGAGRLHEAHRLVRRSLTAGLLMVMVAAGITHAHARNWPMFVPPPCIPIPIIPTVTLFDGASAPKRRLGKNNGAEPAARIFNIPRRLTDR